MTYSTYCKSCHNEMGRKYYAFTKKKTAVNSCVHYSAEEIEYLEKNYKKKTAVQIALILHRTAQSIRRKAFMLGLRKIASYRKKK